MDGRNGRRFGLVDKLGGIDDALAAAAKRANVENYTIISYPEKESLFMNLLNSQRKHYVNSQMKDIWAVSTAISKYYKT